jgi:hypothetical protein
MQWSLGFLIPNIWVFMSLPCNHPKDTKIGNQWSNRKSKFMCNVTIVTNVAEWAQVSTSGFFFQILWGRCCSDHPQEDLAKFGYRSERKEEKFRNPAIFWQHALTYCLTLVISKIKNKKSSKSGDFEPFFPQKNPLYKLHWLFLWVTRMQNFTKKTTLKHIHIS